MTSLLNLGLRSANYWLGLIGVALSYLSFLATFADVPLYGPLFSVVDFYQYIALSIGDFFVPALDFFLNFIDWSVPALYQVILMWSVPLYGFVFRPSRHLQGLEEYIWLAVHFIVMVALLIPFLVALLAPARIALAVSGFNLSSLRVAEREEERGSVAPMAPMASIGINAILAGVLAFALWFASGAISG